VPNRDAAHGCTRPLVHLVDVLVRRHHAQDGADGTRLCAAALAKVLSMLSCIFY
jgi:hypothetical protein